MAIKVVVDDDKYVAYRLDKDGNLKPGAVTGSGDTPGQAMANLIEREE